ncbi:MAG: DUF4912 domain-containing protein [Planctomycetales bacterium]|nr:DUF4912 domain-containing protein [Planctomycetales bacterium]
MTPATLKEYTLKDLAQMAKKRGIAGWHSMRKDDLVKALLKLEKSREKARAAKSNPRGRAALTASAKSSQVSGKAKTSSHRQAKADSTARNDSRRSSTAARADRGATNGAVSKERGASGRKKITTAKETAGVHDTKASARHNETAKSHTNGSRKAAANTSAKRITVIDKKPAQAVPRPASLSAKAARPAAKAPPQRLSAVARKIQKAQQELEQRKDLSGPAAPVKVRKAPTPPPAPRVAPPPVVTPGDQTARDRVVLMVRDPYWLHVHWEMTSRSVQRAQAAMAEYWHTARPVIRLMEISSRGTTSATEMFVRDIEIHGGVNNWYIDVQSPPRGYRVEIGYVASNGRFHGLARSNSVETPEPGVRDAFDHTWVDVAENCERIFALSGGYSPENATDELQEVLEERLCRPVGSPLMSRYSGITRESINDREANFTLEVDAEMIVFGSTKPGAHVTMGGEPIKLRDDGSFALRLPLPDRRQVLPITSSSRDGVMEQTVVLAVERNTKTMEAVTRDANE